MILYISEDSGRLIQDPSFSADLNTVNFKRGDSTEVDIRFCSNTLGLSANPARQISFGIKNSGKYDGPFIVNSNIYTIRNNGYVMNPSFNTITLNQSLSSGDGNETNDLESITAMLEISWSDGLSAYQSTQTVNAVISNDVIKGNESTPLAQPTPEKWLSDRYFIAPYNIDGNFRIFVENQASYSGTNNIGLGINSLAFNTGSDTIALGQNSSTSNTGEQVIAIGLEAGYGNTGDNNIFLGSYTNASAGISNAIVLGRGASATESNTIVLGSTVTPLLTSATGTTTGKYLIVRLNGQNVKLPIYV